MQLSLITPPYRGRMAAASMTLAVLFLAGCSREQAEPSAQQEISEAVTSGPVTCYARYESLGAAGGDAATKADIDGLGAFTWASDGSDCIAVYNSNSAYSLTNVDPGGRFTATRYSGTTYPVYPYKSASSGTNITYPDSYAIAGSMGYSSPTPMMAVDGGSGDLTFYHVGSLLRLTLNNVPVGTKSIEVTLTRSSGYSTGTGTVSNPGTSTSSASITSGGNRVTFTLDYALARITHGFMLNVPVPPGTYTGINVACKDTDGNETLLRNNTTSRTLARAEGSRITMKMLPTSLSGLKAAINDGMDCSDCLGWYVTSDGGIHDNSGSAPDGTIGRVAYMSTENVDVSSAASGSRILVLATTNVGSYQWKTSASSGESAYNSTSALNGLAFCESHNNSTYPAAQAAYGWSTSKPSGSTKWFLPSYAQLNNMLTVAKKSGTGQITSGWYWSATEGASYADRAWRYLFDYSVWANDSKASHTCYVRACFAY